MIKRGLAVLSLTILGLVAGGQAANASPALPLDPSPYCRPYIGHPYVDAGPIGTGGGRYQFDVEVAGGLTCNGPVYKASVSVILHYSTDPSGGTGIATGATHECTGSCEGTAHFYRTGLRCGYHYTYSDYGTYFATWQRTSSSAPVSVSDAGPTTRGSSYNPSAACG